MSRVCIRRKTTPGRLLWVAVAAALALPAAAPAPAPGGPPAVVDTALEPRGVWGDLCWLSRRAHLKCKTSPAGKFLINAVRPISALSGGLIPTPNDNHFAAAVELHATKPPGMHPGAAPAPPPPPPPGVAAAAKIKTEQAQAQIRRDAVAYLAGLDCRYYPEAEAALIASLRADRDECVRLEAARALSSGCCCTPAVVKALSICVTGSEEDGNPAERSGRVRRAALYALEKCAACQACQPTPVGGESPEAPIPLIEPTEGVTPASYAAPSNPPPAAARPPAATGETTLWGLWKSAGKPGG
ncbi:HEAT repeat domain-containing protein [Botrimarina sp.]|uniref:HEAT repeat domain-containing protein n=1 Tax=Botrimarina sp. TaxID=2795802 RepID=UPI0032ECB242